MGGNSNNVLVVGDVNNIVDVEGYFLVMLLVSNWWGMVMFDVCGGGLINEYYIINLKSDGVCYYI